MSEFKVLSDREHIKLRTGVYAGSVVAEPITGIINYNYQSKTVVPALIKCVEEVYQNSVDEALRTNYAYANKISINIKSTINGTEIINIARLWHGQNFALGQTLMMQRDESRQAPTEWVVAS